MLPLPLAAPVLTGDTADYEQVNAFARSTGWLHGPATAYATYGVVLFAALLVAGYLLARRRRDPLLLARSVLAGAGVLLAVGVNQPLIAAVGEPRPFVQVPGALVLVHRSLDASFPSDHATMAGAVAAGLLLVDRRLGLTAAALAALMAATRVYVGAHFPVDVVAGLALGAVVALLVQLAAPALAAGLGRLQRTRLRPVLSAAPDPAGTGAP